MPTLARVSNLDLGLHAEICSNFQRCEGVYLLSSKLSRKHFLFAKSQVLGQNSGIKGPLRCQFAAFYAGLMRYVRYKYKKGDGSSQLTQINEF